MLRYTKAIDEHIYVVNTTTASVKVISPSTACNSLDIPNSYYHAIDMLKFSQCLGKKYTPVHYIHTPKSAHFKATDDVGWKHVAVIPY